MIALLLVASVLLVLLTMWIADRKATGKTG